VPSTCSSILETAMAVRQSKTRSARTQPRRPRAHPTKAQADAAAEIRHAARRAEQVRREAEECAKLASLPVKHEHAAGIDVGDATHWVCVESTPDGADTVREFPAHTPGLRQLVAWLQFCAVTTVALEASGVYGHVLFLTLLEAGFTVVMTAPAFTRQIKGRPKTDRRDCHWIQRLHKHGLLPSVFQPDEATHTLRDLVRQRANSCAPQRPTHSAPAEGPGADEPQADEGARRRHRRDRPEDHSGHRPRRTRSPEVGQAA
jgi:hypothetical protein